MKKFNENGRSMVEMLGVLAIIGVLSVGGIAGYSKAMNKYKINKTTDQVSMLVANIRTLFSSQGNYAGLNNSRAVKFGVVPNEMYSGTPTGDTANFSIKNAFSGNVTIIEDQARSTGETANEGEAFIIEYAGLSAEACVTIATGDWGSGQASGLIGIAAGAGTVTTPGTLGTIGNAVADVYVDKQSGVGEDDEVTGTQADDGLVVAAPGASIGVPISVTNAVKACNGGGSGNAVAWKYY